jgi:gliding motility-associated-like protein
LFSVSIPEIIYNVTTGEACFYVTAGEISNPHGITGESKSREICFVIEEVITVPNLFTPDGDSRNDLFKPVIAFSPSDYQLIISNRQGKVLVRSNDFSEAWDGSDNGDPVPEGVYMWVMKLTLRPERNLPGPEQ